MTAKKSARLEIRLAEPEKAIIMKRAAKAGLPLSEFVRRRALSKRDEVSMRLDIPELRCTHTTLKRAGNLLNQSVRKLHMGHCSDELKAELMQAFRAVTTSAEVITDLISEERK